MTLTMACKNIKMVSSSCLLMMAVLSNFSLSVFIFFTKSFFENFLTLFHIEGEISWCWSQLTAALFSTRCWSTVRPAA